MMVANVAASQNWINNSVPNQVTTSKNILSFFLPKNWRINLIHGKFNNTVTKTSLSSSVVINKLDELNRMQRLKNKTQIFWLSIPTRWTQLYFLTYSGNFFEKNPKNLSRGRHLISNFAIMWNFSLGKKMLMYRIFHISFE
jgi:hypothetical protein